MRSGPCVSEGLEVHSAAGMPARMCTLRWAISRHHHFVTSHHRRSSVLLIFSLLSSCRHHLFSLSRYHLANLYTWDTINIREATATPDITWNLKSQIEYDNMTQRLPLPQHCTLTVPSIAAHQVLEIIHSLRNIFLLHCLPLPQHCALTSSTVHRRYMYVCFP